MHPLSVGTQVPICTSTKDGMAYFFPIGIGVKKYHVIFDAAGHRWLKMQSIEQRGPKNYFQDPSGFLIVRPTRQGRLDTGGGESK